MMSEKPVSGSELLLYQTEDNRTRIEVRLEHGTVWLTQAQLAALYQSTPQNITLHVRAIYLEEELAEEATCKEYLQVPREACHAAETPGDAPQANCIVRLT